MSKQNKIGGQQHHPSVGNFDDVPVGGGISNFHAGGVVAPVFRRSEPSLSVPRSEPRDSAGSEEPRARPFLRKGTGRLGTSVSLFGQGSKIEESQMDATMNGTTPGPKQRENSGYSDLHQSRKLKLRPEESGQSREHDDRVSWAMSSEHGDEAAEDVRRAHSRLNLHRPSTAVPASTSSAASRMPNASVERPTSAPSRRFDSVAAASADMDQYEGGYPGLSQQVTVSAPSQSDNAVHSMNNVKLAQLTKENATLRAELAAMRASELQLRDKFQDEVDHAVALKTKQKDAEINKLREALRVSERQVKASLKHNTAKKERDEVQVLQQTISKLKQDLTARETTVSMALEKSRQTINQLEHQLSLGDGAYAKKEADLRSSFSRRERELQDAFDELYERNQLLHQQLLAFSAKNKASSSNEAAVAPSHSPVKQQQQQQQQQPQQQQQQQQPFRSFDSRVATDSFASSSNAPPDAAPSASSRLSASSTSAASSHKVITHSSNGAVEQVKDDGSRIISYRNGSSKEFAIDGRIIVRYSNGDIKETATDGTITYFYFETGATQIMYPNGLKVISFANKQMEKHYPDGTKEIVFPNRVRKTIHPDGRQQIFE